MRYLVLTIVLALLGAAVAAPLSVHPFQSQDPALGMIVADRVAEALGDGAIGPAATPALVAPIVAPNGFVSPTVFIDDPGLGGRNAAWLLRGVIGADAAVTGSLRAEGDALVLRLEADVAGRERRAVLRGERDDPGALAQRAAVLVAAWTGSSAAPVGAIDMSGVDGAIGRALGLVAAGLPLDALATLDQAAAEAALPARAGVLRDVLREAVEGGTDTVVADHLDTLALRAVVALNLGDLAGAGAAFTVLGAAGVPVGDVWAGVIAHNEGADAEAEAAFDRAATNPAFDAGLASRAAYRHTVAGPDGDAGTGSDLDALVARPGASAGSLLVGVVAANLAGDPVREDALAARLERVAPFLTFSFERRSFLAFDRDDALGAATALAVAIELAAESDLYWTNYGWALYLLGFLERSEAASRRALELDPGQVIARYNLGLVEVVTDRLDDALATYREALRFDPRVEPEAIVDLIDAEELYPDAIGVPFALAELEAARGEREAAAAAFERYVALATEREAHRAADPARVREASERAAALRAPLPPIAVEGAIDLRLGRRGPVVDTAQPGDPLVVGFEVSTIGDALPRVLALSAALEDGDGVVLATAEREVDVPVGAIGFVVEVARLELPDPLMAGRYTLVVRATGDGLEAEAVRGLDVGGASDIVRRLVGRDVGLVALETEQALFAPRDVAQPGVVMARLLAELHAAAPIAEEVLPVIDAGRFAGSSGGAAFADSVESDVVDFLRFVLAEGAADTSFTFVDGYAEWLLQGAP